jgi:hypothetical protein
MYLLKNDEVLFFNISTKNWIRKGGSIARQKHTSRLGRAKQDIWGLGAES